MLRADFIKRLIEQLAQFVARVAQMIQDNKLEEASAELLEAERALGLPHGIGRLDPRSLSLLLGGKDKVVLYCAILEQRAALASAEGNPAQAEELRARAKQLLAFAAPEELEQAAEQLRARL